MRNVPTMQKGPNEELDSPIGFIAADCLEKLMHFLPSQTPLKDFIHHNSLHAFQDRKFFDAIFEASKIFGYQVTLELKDFRGLHAMGRIKASVLDRLILQKKGDANAAKWRHRLLEAAFDETKQPRVGRLRSLWKPRLGIDLDNAVHPLLFRVMGHYLDQGISLWGFPQVAGGCLASIRVLERESFASFFSTQRAKQLLLDESCTLEHLLGIVVGDPALFEQYLFDQQFAHRGWSGMVATLETHPETLLSPREITLQDFIQLELLLEIDAIEGKLGSGWQPLAVDPMISTFDIFAPTEKTELDEVFEIWQEAFEWSYYDEVLAGLLSAEPESGKSVKAPTFQAIFCIDERECSFRRHLEGVAPHCETWGSPGFFGVEFYYQQAHAQFYDKLCPAPVTPKYLIKESDSATSHSKEALYTNNTSKLFWGSLLTFSLGLWASVKMLLLMFRPKMSPAISNAFAHMDERSTLSIENRSREDMENGLQIGFTIEEMAVRVEGLLRSIGMVSQFAQLIYVVAHGSSSANNPHHGAHDCGACSGRPGAVNAKVFAFMANHPRVRKILADRGIEIPAKTQFLGALHDTASDQIAYYLTESLSPVNEVAHAAHKAAFDNALNLNAKERSRRFASIDTGQSPQKVRRAILKRSVSMFEPRPELGHGTNTLCFVGRRELTKQLFLDRRAFLNSYDYRTDPEGKLLAGVMRPLGPVCGGINLEYYFSRVDNHKLGAGTKLPHNVMGLIGVVNSCDGDLRPGLPLQMIEVHDPVRLLIVVEHFPEVVLRTVQSSPEMYQWFINEWVNLVAFDPLNKTLHRFNAGKFVDYMPQAASPSTITDFESYLESAKEMESNHILDATKENLPVHLIRS
ncbi:MAG: DUF2309 domain-containing protein [Bacteroidetes bacterium]|nr:DUF2309 domain-containing protein [Bacteroidota bacterium]